MDLGYYLPIKVLVWGPGKANRQGYAKREKIRSEIKQRFPNSEVYFSEDKELGHVTSDLGDPLIEEIVHANAADIIIALDVSRGSQISRGVQAEIDFLSQDASIAKKLWVLIPDRFAPLSGFVKQILNGIEVEFYSDAEFNDCTLASDKCVGKVLARAHRLKHLGVFQHWQSSSR